MWWRIIAVLLVLGGLIGFGLVYSDLIWSMVQKVWGLDDALRKKILDILTIIAQVVVLLGIVGGFFAFIVRFIKGKPKDQTSNETGNGASLIGCIKIRGDFVNRDKNTNPAKQQDDD